MLEVKCVRFNRIAPYLGHITFCVREICTLKQWGKGCLKKVGRGGIQNPNLIPTPTLLLALLIQQEILPVNIFVIFLEHLSPIQTSLIFPCEKVKKSRK